MRGLKLRWALAGVPVLFALLFTVFWVTGQIGTERLLAANQHAHSFRLAPTTFPQRVLLDRDELGIAVDQLLLPSSTRSLLATEGTLRHGDFVWNDHGVADGALTVWIDIHRQTISVFRAGHEVGTAIVAYGAPSMETPEGRFLILSKSQNYHSRTYDAPMPYSMFLTQDGIAIHGSEISARRATHGCIGLPIAFAKKLFDEATLGDEVVIVRSNS